MVTTPLRRLLYSRKFLLALFAVAQTLVLHYYSVDPEVWAAIDAMVGVLIASIAHEDAAEKAAPSAIQTMNVDSSDA